MLDSLDTLIAFVMIMLLVSLLITIVVQMISTAFNLRGMNLATALALTLDTASPGTTRAASKATKDLANHILKLPYLSDSGVIGARRATAIRPSEVFQALLDIATAPLDKDPSLARTARKVLARAGIPEIRPQALHDSEETLNKVLEFLRGAKQQPLASELEAGYQLTAAPVNAAITKTTDAVTAAQKQFCLRFESAQNRAQQWFATHARLITIPLALVAAFALQLDTVEIYGLVSTNRALRDKLVAEAGNVSARAEKTLGDTPGVLDAAVKGWRQSLAKETDPQTDGDAKKAYGQLPADARAAVDALSPAAGETRDGFLVRLGTTLGSAAPSSPITGALVHSFGGFLDSVVQMRLKNQSADFAALTQEADRTGFPIYVPGDGRWAQEKDENGQPLGRWPIFNRHTWGMLMTAGLLALGAPFWYNLLRGLMSLRSVVATDIHEENRTAKFANIRARATASAEGSFLSDGGSALSQPASPPSVKPGAT